MKYSIIFLVTFSLYSCSKFCKCDPLPPGDNISIKFLNAAGQNLFFGPSAIYKIDSLQFLIVRNGQLINSSSSVSGSGTDIAVWIDYAPKFYISYSSAASRDSLELKWRPYTAKCCGEKYTAYEITELKFNNTVINKVNNTYTVIK
jgi:hypothetical protein